LLRAPTCCGRSLPFALDIGQIEPGVCKLRVERERVAKGGLGFNVPPQHRQGVAQVAVRGRVVALDVDRLGDQAHGIGVALVLVGEQAEIMRGVGVLRLLREQLLIAGLGLGQSACLVQPQRFLQDLTCAHRWRRGAPTPRAARGAERTSASK
jgi:hypothetical protein